MGLGQVHRAGPAPFRHLRREKLLLLLAAVDEQRGESTRCQTGIHAERHVGGGDEFVDGNRQRVRQALAAILRIDGESDPAAFGISLEGFLEALRGPDVPLAFAHAAFAVAGKVQRLQHFLAEFCRLAENSLDDVGCRIGEAREIVVAIDLEYIAEEERDLLHRRFVARHGKSPAVRGQTAPGPEDSSYVNYLGALCKGGPAPAHWQQFPTGVPELAKFNALFTPRAESRLQAAKP